MAQNRYSGTPVPTGAQLRRVTQIKLHPDFVDPTNQNDIALLKLNEVVTFGANIRPICMSMPSNQSNRAFIDELYTNCWQAGWGKIATTGYSKW